MIIFQLTNDTNPLSMRGTVTPWHAGTKVIGGFTRAVEEFAETLPEGEHLLAVLSVAGVDEPKTPMMLRLARVVRKPDRLVTTILPPQEA